MRGLNITKISLFIQILLFSALVGCAGVKVSLVKSSDYMQLRRGDILTTGKLSAYTGATLQVFGVDKKKCLDHGAMCREVLMNTIGVHSENRFSSLAELQLEEAKKLDSQPREDKRIEDLINAYLETTRYAYAYLFMTRRTPEKRALEDRQTQVRDYYSFAVQQILTTLFEYYSQKPPTALDGKHDIHLQFGEWNITIRNEDIRFAGKRIMPEELIPASSLSFTGLRNQYRRDGLGAELVAVTSRRVVNMQSVEQPFSETPFPAITAVVSFPGNTIQEILQTHDVTITGYDPYGRESVV